MTLRYWHKLAILIACISLGGVILTASYAHVLSRQASATTDNEQALARSLLTSSAQLIGSAAAANAAHDAIDAPAREIARAIFEAQVNAKAGIAQVTVCRLDETGKTIRQVFSVSSTTSADAPDMKATIPSGLSTALFTAIPKPGPRKPTEAVSTFESLDGEFLWKPIQDPQGNVRGWIVARLGEPANAESVSSRSSLMVFALSLCGVLLVASVVAAWMFGRRMRELGAALARVGDGHSDIHLDDDSHDEMGDMARAANRTARTLRETMDLRRSMRLAEQVQRALLPAKPPTLPGLQIAHFCDYCDEVGGDYIDYIPVGDDQQPDGWAVVVGDGTGHGVGAALLMATARSVLRSQPLRFGDLAKGVGIINQHICEQVPDGKFVTLFMLVFSADAKRLCWLSAGHDEAILFDPLNGEFSELRGSDLPLGVEASWEFTHHSRQSPLARGTVIVIGTDGIWEMRNASDQMFGKDRLKRIMRRAASEAGPEIGRQILEALHQHRGDLPPQDDVTFVVIKVDG